LASTKFLKDVGWLCLKQAAKNGWIDFFVSFVLLKTKYPVFGKTDRVNHAKFIFSKFFREVDDCLF